MALKSKRPSAEAKRGGTKTTPSIIGKMHYAGAVATKKSPKRLRAEAVETIEARLDRKATVADNTAFASESLGQMTREKRHKLLYGD
jgi:hypothetical protein